MRGIVGYSVTETMRRRWLLIGTASLIVVLLAYAWQDGGREPIRLITQPVALPEAPE